MSKTIWQKKKRDEAFQKRMSGWIGFVDSIDGSGVFPTIRLEWRKSSYMLYFDWDGTERHVNIIEQCRRYCGRLTAEKRAKIEAAMPKSIEISTRCDEYYAQGCSYNMGGYRYLHTASNKDLQNWLGNI